MTFKELVNKSVTKKVKFMTDEVEISKLSVASVKRIQKLATSIDRETGDGGLELMIDVVKTSVPEALTMSDDDFAEMPFDELKSLSDMIMEFSGMKEAGNVS